MKIRQEESTPIGNWFHDNGMMRAFNKLSEQVDEFDVDTDELSDCCDCLITLAKGLKAQIKKVEAEWQKRQTQKKVMGEFNEL